MTIRGAGPLARGLGVVAALLLGEAAVRQHYTSSSTYVAGYGYVTTPGTTLVSGREGHARSHWLDRGVRAGTRIVPEQPLVLVLGDSFTEAAQVADDETFSARAQQQLDARGVALSVANAGRSTTSVADYVVHAERYAKMFQARWTVVEMLESDLEADAWKANGAHFARDEAGTLGVVPFVPPPRAGLSGRLWDLRQEVMLVGYGVVRLGEFHRAYAAEPPLFRPARKPAPEPPPTYPIEAELDLLVEAYGGRLTLLMLPRFQRTPPYRVESDTYLRWRRYCERPEISCADASDGFARLAGEGRAPAGFDNTQFNEGHWNVSGHAVAGEALAAALAEVRRRGLL